MPLTAYFDAAGHEADQPLVVVGGFVAPPQMWCDFSDAWKERLASDSIKYFHAVEFAHSRGQFEGWRDEKKKREKLSHDLMDIIKRNVSRKFVSVVNVEALKTVMSEEVKAAFLINSYSLAGRSCAARLREWQNRENWVTQLELVFENGDLGKGNLKERLLRDGFSPPSFRPKNDHITADGTTIEGLSPLQAADWLAYESFIAARDLRGSRWPFTQFLHTPGPIRIYLAEDVRRLEALANERIDEVIRENAWRDLGDQLKGE